jgi:hypothetical protein
MTSGFAIMVDGHIKASFESKDSAFEAGRELKARFPHLQVKIFDAETKRSEAVAGAGACGINRQPRAKCEPE